MKSQVPPPPDGAQDRSAVVAGMVIGALTLSIVSVALRMIARKFLLKNVGWDDWTIVAAVAGTTIGAGLDIPLVKNGYGRHRYYLNEHQYREFMKFGYIEWVQTFFTLMLLKISICLLLLRIVVTQKNIIRPIQTLITILVLSHVVLALLWILQCKPVDAAWISTKQGRCFSEGQLEQIIMAQAVISIISDFILAGFPILILRKVQICLRTKITCCILMGLGLITAAACIVRTVLNWQNVSQDESWVGVVNFMWRTVEINVGICAACIPTYLPLWRWMRDVWTKRVKKDQPLYYYRHNKTSHQHLRHQMQLQTSTEMESSNASQDLPWSLPKSVASENSHLDNPQEVAIISSLDLERGL